MSIYDQMAGAQVQGRGIKIAENGDFVVRIDRVHMVSSNQGHGELWVTEYTVVQGTLDNPKDCERSWVQRPEVRPQTDPGNIKAFVAALEGITNPNETDVPANLFVEAVGEAQPYAGQFLKLNTQVVQTKAGFDFTVHTWSPHDGSVEVSTAPTPPTPPPPTAPAPSIPQVPLTALTKELWLSGQGKAITHPDNPAYEYSKEHPDWGVRSCS